MIEKDKFEDRLSQKEDKPDKTEIDKKKDRSEDRSGKMEDEEPSEYDEIGGKFRSKDRIGEKEDKLGKKDRSEDRSRQDRIPKKIEI